MAPPRRRRRAAWPALDAPQAVPRARCATSAPAAGRPALRRTPPPARCADFRPHRARFEAALGAARVIRGRRRGAPRARRAPRRARPPGVVVLDGGGGVAWWSRPRRDGAPPRGDRPDFRPPVGTAPVACRRRPLHQHPLRRLRRRRPGGAPPPPPPGAIRARGRRARRRRRCPARRRASRRAHAMTGADGARSRRPRLRRRGDRAPAAARRPRRPPAGGGRAGGRRGGRGGRCAGRRIRTFGAPNFFVHLR